MVLAAVYNPGMRLLAFPVILHPVRFQKQQESDQEHDGQRAHAKVDASA